MNLKLNNEPRNTSNEKTAKSRLTVKEERQRNGRYVAVLVGISLFLLAIYHAWVRKIPLIASLIVPAIIMFIYVGWVLYTASRDKHRALDAEAALNRALDDASDSANNNSEIITISTCDISKLGTNDVLKNDRTNQSSGRNKGETENNDTSVRKMIKPLILVNDELPNDIEQILLPVINLDTLNSVKFRDEPFRKKFKRKFCRPKRCAAFKRSYSIA